MPNENEFAGCLLKKKSFFLFRKIGKREKKKGGRIALLKGKERTGEGVGGRKSWNRMIKKVSLFCFQKLCQEQITCATLKQTKKFFHNIYQQDILYASSVFEI